MERLQLTLWGQASYTVLYLFFPSMPASSHTTHSPTLLRSHLHLPQSYNTAISFSHAFPFMSRFFLSLFYQGKFLSRSRCLEWLLCHFKIVIGTNDFKCSIGNLFKCLASILIFTFIFCNMWVKIPTVWSWTQLKSILIVLDDFVKRTSYAYSHHATNIVTSQQTMLVVKRIIV